jgi:hypothetical protein
VRELLVCWLFFSLFVCVMLSILSGVLAVQARECLAVWARTLARMMMPVGCARVPTLPKSNVPKFPKLKSCGNVAEKRVS